MESFPLMLAQPWSALLFVPLLAACASPEVSRTPSSSSPVAATSASSHLRLPDEDPAVEVVLAAVPSRVGPGEYPALTATIRNHGLVAFWVSADDAPAPAVRLSSLASHVRSSSAHRPIAMEPARVLVPPGESRAVRIRDPGDHADSWARWTSGLHEVSVNYTTPTSPSVATWSRSVVWKLLDDGSAAARDGRLELVTLSLTAYSRSRPRTRVVIWATNREIRSIPIPEEVELSWWSGREQIAHERRALGELPRLAPHEARQLAMLDVAVPDARGPLVLRAALTRPGEHAPAIVATTALR